MPNSDSTVGSRLLCIAIPVVGLIVLLTMVLTTRMPPTYDEPWYLETVSLLDRHGLTSEFLRALPGPAGPLYTLIHWLLRPITALETPGVRLVNVGFLIGCLLLLVPLCHATGVSDVWPTALAGLAVPAAWKFAGMALTELPAMFFLELAMLCVLARQLRWTLAIAGGVCFGLAVLGRQPYFVAIAALPILCRERKDWAGLALFASATALVVVPVVVAWGGVAPPRSDTRAETMVLSHGVWSFAYAATFAVILAPTFLRVNRVSLTASIIAACVLAVLMPPHPPPLQSVVQRLLPAPALPWFARAAMIPMMGAGVWFIISLALHTWERRWDRTFAALGVALFLVLLTPVIITHLFGSRYVATALPLLVLVTAPWSAPTYWKSARVLLGCVLGAVSLWSFYAHGAS